MVPGPSGPLASGIFEFTRGTQLRQTFPQSGPTILTPAQLDHQVKLTHPFAGGLANYEPVAPFTLVSGAGVAIVTGSEIPSGRAFVLLGAHMFHTDVVANRPCLFQLVRVNTGVQVTIQSSKTTAGGISITATGVPGNTAYVLRPVIVPPGWALQGVAEGLGGADTVSFVGMGMVVPLSEEPPALWPAI